MNIDEFWESLVSSALLGTDRRDPPPTPPGVIDDAVRDLQLPDSASRLLAQVASTVAVRRGAFMPSAPLSPIALPEPDDRPPCSVRAAQRWRHVIVSWPVLDDEWLLTLITSGQRARAEVVPELLRRHRRDAVRYTRAVVAAGPLAAWLIRHCPELGRVGSTPPPADALGELPALPVPPELTELFAASGEEIGTWLLDRAASGRLSQSDRAVLINFLARLRPNELPAVASALADGAASGVASAGLLAALGDLAHTRATMLDELTVVLGPTA